MGINCKPIQPFQKLAYDQKQVLFLTEESPKTKEDSLVVRR